MCSEPWRSRQLAPDMPSLPAHCPDMQKSHGAPLDTQAGQRIHPEMEARTSMQQDMQTQTDVLHRTLMTMCQLIVFLSVMTGLWTGIGVIGMSVQLRQAGMTDQPAPAAETRTGEADSRQYTTVACHSHLDFASLGVKITQVADSSCMS